MWKVLIGLIVFCSPLLTLGQSDRWNKEMSKSGKVKVNSKVTKITNEKGEKIQVAEYNTETIVVMNLDKAIATMKNVPIHPKFMKDTEISKRVKTISDTEWIIYYGFDAPWPLPNSDCVVKVKYALSEDGKTATFYGVADASLYEIQEVPRMNHFSVLYTFENMGSGRIKFTMETKMTPVVTVPDWLVNTWFPEGPAEIIERFIALVNENK